MFTMLETIIECLMPYVILTSFMLGRRNGGNNGMSVSSVAHVLFCFELCGAKFHYLIFVCLAGAFVF